METSKKNTLAFEFPKDAPGPSLSDMSRFVKKLHADPVAMDTCYRNADDKCIFIRFTSAEAFNDVMLYNPEVLTFHYGDGKTTEVKMSVAGGIYKYVRIFNLPPEVEDDDIGRVLTRYGKVKKHVREKFPPECELDLYSGIRGVYMDIQKEVPASLFIRNCKARIYYEGFKNRCFHCKANDHLKANCPKLAELKDSTKNGDEIQDDGGSQRTYAPSRSIEERVDELSKKQELLEDGVKNCVDEVEVGDNTARSEGMDVDDGGFGMKRALTDSTNSRSESDESHDEAEQTNTAKNSTKRQKGEEESEDNTVEPSPLEVIQNVPKAKVEDAECAKTGESTRSRRATGRSGRR